MKKVILIIPILVGCTNISAVSSSSSSRESTPVVTEYKTLSKEDYYNKTLSGLLGQFAGFLSGYEFVKNGPDPYIGMPDSWFDFINGPYAGNYAHYYPGSYAQGNNKYNRLRLNTNNNRYEVYSDDDYHIDIFNQTILDEYGSSSYGIYKAWKKYGVADWGGGYDTNRLVGTYDLLSPFTGTIEAGNTLSWCTEAYIENETLGMNAPGMPQLALSLVDKFASNVGYFDPVIWAKYYAVIYSLAYFEDDVYTILEEANKVLPENSWPYRIMQASYSAYEKYPNDFRKAGKELVELRRITHGIDNIQTDPAINGAFAILSLLYGNNDYLLTCKIASLLGFDGDCTAAIATSVIGIMKGFKITNPEYQKINEKIYYDGEGVYVNDTTTGYDTYIKREYPEKQKITDIVELYQKNFEKLLIEEGGEIFEDYYSIPVSNVKSDSSVLFSNYDLEEKSSNGFLTNSAMSVIGESENVETHSGWRGLKLQSKAEGEAKVYHNYNLEKDAYYRLSVYCKTSDKVQASLYAKTNEITLNEEYFYNVNNVINKVLVFQASSSSVEVGVKLLTNSGYLTVDDFLLEKIEMNSFNDISTSFNKYPNKYVSQLSKPNYEKEVFLRVKYRNSASKLIVKINRNNTLFGSVILSQTSKDNNIGYGYLEIPYVFENESDNIMIDFQGNSLYFGDIEIIQRQDYMFR
ncbi:MAG: ADP-ribosylglycohydrolase family protein [Bacillales bacterium]|jgi:hypothetical protein|nr:ADP-ribosylglycohydrolase family protein [Bacillales bacterium]